MESGAVTSSAESLVASQTGKMDAMRVSALSGRASSSRTKRTELTSTTETQVSFTRAGMDSGSGRPDEWGDAWSSPLPSVVALGSLDVRVEWGSAII